ncbi:MAG: hypothetical protein A3F72_13695 [Bacteroidetes bacterium RIFCSPLOWO2_12_FULL_35_15]|nr:MAG: hypothetical protein A3F72_13695 [Bacteroidetes bacterium RIFCSPLOWO2_12_FULL_35_15]
MLVYIQRNYNYPDLFRQTPNCNGEWLDMKFTTLPVERADYIVVLNHPLTDIRMKCLKGGKFLIVQEPPYKSNEYFKLHFRFYNKVISGFSGEKSINVQAGLPWHINKNYDELVSLKKDTLQFKNDGVSWITSNNNLFPAHKIRLDFIDFLKKKEFKFDLFGRGFKEISDKFDGIYPYKYTIAAENYIANDYFTEKIFDAYLSWSMPIYFGCKNITDYFPAESLIQVDLNFPEEALEKIKDAQKNKLWEKNIEAIQYARELILNKYQLFPMLYDFVKANKGEDKYESVFIPHTGLTKMESFKKEVKKIFKRQ